MGSAIPASMLVSFDSILSSQPRRDDTESSYSCTPSLLSPRTENVEHWTAHVQTLKASNLKAWDGSDRLLHSTSNLLPVLGELDLNR